MDQLTPIVNPALGLAVLKLCSRTHLEHNYDTNVTIVNETVALYGIFARIKAPAAAKGIVANTLTLPVKWYLANDIKACHGGGRFHIDSVGAHFKMIV